MIINKEELLTTRTRLIDEISSISFDEFNRNADTETWSIAQVCHHLYLTEIAFTKAIIYGLSKMESSKTEPKNIDPVLDRSKKITAPDMVIPSTEPFDIQQILHLLDQSRNKLLTFLSTIEDPSLLVDKSTKHRIFGDLPLNQWIDLIFLHEQRHIEQIKELKRLVAQ